MRWLANCSHHSERICLGILCKPRATWNEKEMGKRASLTLKSLAGAQEVCVCAVYVLCMCCVMCCGAVVLWCCVMMVMCDVVVWCGVVWCCLCCVAACLWLCGGLSSLCCWLCVCFCGVQEKRDITSVQDSKKKVCNRTLIHPQGILSVTVKKTKNITYRTNCDYYGFNKFENIESAPRPRL